MIQHYLGKLLLVDVVQCGFYAHRLQKFWTNLTPAFFLEFILRNTIQDPTLQISQILDADNLCQPRYQARKSTLIFIQHHCKVKKCLTHIRELSRCPCFSSLWTRTYVLSHYIYMEWTKPWGEKKGHEIHLCTKGYMKLTRLERNSLLSRVMDLNV